MVNRRISLLLVALHASNVWAVNPWPYQNPGGVPATTAVATGNSMPMPNPTANSANTQLPQNSPTGADANANSLPQFLQQLNSSPGQAGGYGSFPGYNSGVDGSGHPFMPQTPGSGRLEPCGQIAQGSQVARARDEAISFRNECALAQRGDNQRIAVNDYSASSTPYMYIFDVHGKCLYKTAVTYGNGAGPVRPLPCSRGGTNLTPPGIHITAPHRNGSAYNESNSTLMVGLEGQQSAGRGILIHYARSPGTASSWGCAGVGPYDQVRAVLGYGSLVYNFFGETQMANGCGNSAGMGKPKGSQCRMDQGATPVPTVSTSGPAPEVSR